MFISPIIFTALFLYFLEISWEIWKRKMDNDKDMVEKAARYIVYIIYDETSLSGLTMALSACIWRGVGHFLPYYQKWLRWGRQLATESTVTGRGWYIARTSISFTSFPLSEWGRRQKAEVRHISEQVTRRTFTQTCGTWLYSRRASLRKAF